MRRAGIALYVHLVWATWDRQPLLQGDVERQVYRAIGAKCEELDTEIIALGGIADHIHLLVSIPATLNVADLVKHIKGASSHLLASQQKSPQNGFFKWQGAYGACTVSPRALSEVAHYITHQRAHHAAGSLLAELEPLPKLPQQSNG
jgi:REP element-mobilizing transposase RayT